MNRYLFIVFFLLNLSAIAQRGDDIIVKKQVKLMGTAIEIGVVAPSEQIGAINIDEAVSEIRRIENLISSWKEDSETSKINRNAGIGPVRVSPELFELIEQSIELSELTQGAFDISFAAVDDFWRFDGTMRSIPSSVKIKESVDLINYQNIELNDDEQTVFLREHGMKIAFGAIGLGFTVDKAKELLISKGVKGGIVNASGDLTTWGTRETGEKWMIGIADPLNEGQIISWVPIIESSAATSNSNEKHIIFKGKKYSHLMDTKTGYPVTGVLSVSIFAKKAIVCDALATAIFVMGRDAGLHLINQLDGVEVVLVDEDKKVHKSSGIIFDSNLSTER